MTQIGLLLPRSAMYPTMNFDLVDGLKASLTHAGITDFEIKTAGIGLGTSDKEIYTACEKMIFDGVEVIAGYVNPSTAEMLQPLFENANALFLELSPGYQLHSPGYKPRNNFTITLDGILACRTLPAIAANNGDSSFAFTCSFFDAGFRAPFSFFNGLTDVGSQTVFNHAIQLRKADFTLEPLTEYIKAHPGTALMVASCGDMVTDLFGGMEAEPIYAGVSAYAAPFVAEETWLSKSPYPGADITVLVPWSSTLHSESNDAFIAAMKKKNRTANLFSLLSWEAGQMIARALQTSEIADRIALLENYSFVSPRGQVTINADTHESNAPLYLASIKENDTSGMCVLEVQGEADSKLVADNRQKLQQEIENAEGPFTSWFNAYGCLE